MNRRLLTGMAFAGLGLAQALFAATERKLVTYPTVGSLESLDPRFDALVPVNTPIEKLAEGFDWSEGPVWFPADGCLLFSDVPKNVVLRWKEGEAVTEFLKPSGYTSALARSGESGSNGLLLDSKGQLVLCQHGDRRVARLEKNGRFTTLAEYYRLRRFNSPNDAVFRSNGDLYFTDPPYGLEKLNDDPKKELLFSGVYRVTPQGEVHLLTQELGFPNGIGFSPDEKTLYVANSDPQRPIWMAFDVQPDGSLARGRVFFDASSLTSGRKGLPDGLKVDRMGNLFATGPGGVLVIGPDGKHLGTVQTGEATSNCAWGQDGSVLYLTCDMNLCRLKTHTKGKGWK